jgi:hypothetical protein
MQTLSKSVVPVRGITQQSHLTHLTHLTQTFTQIKLLQSKLKQAETVTDVTVIQVDIGKALQTFKTSIQQLKNTA